MVLPSDSSRSTVSPARAMLLASLVASLVVADSRPVSAVEGWGDPAETGLGVSTTARAAPRWTWPIPSPHPVVTDFEAPDQVWSPGHRGIDIAAADGSVVLAPEAGVVHFSGVVVDRPVLSLEHPGGVLSSFEPVEATVSKGQTVQAGQEIGVLRAGHCSGDGCLHLGARVDGDYVSPLLFLGELQRSILLPTQPLP